MSDIEYFYTIEQQGVAEYKERGSRFLAYAFPISSTEDFKKQLAALKKEHPKANHHCFAYRIGNDNNQFRVSDDGEPSGTAGRPILGQIDSRQLRNVLVVVVRYFGGTLLGVPGLIQAYKTATALVLQTVPILQKPVTRKCSLHFDYTLMNEVMRHIKALNIEVVQQDMQLFCNLMVEVPLNRITEFENLIGELRADYKFI